jgi:hypothetical protein|nr:MAG TPA: hypothetical protein [Caudoviricetes sp.]
MEKKAFVGTVWVYSSTKKAETLASPRISARGAFLPAVEHFYIIAGHLFGMVATIDQAKKANFCSQLQKQ